MLVVDGHFGDATSQSHHNGIEISNGKYIASRMPCPNRTIMELKFYRHSRHFYHSPGPNRTIMELKFRIQRTH